MQDWSSLSSVSTTYSLVLDHDVQDDSHLLSLQSMVFEGTSALFHLVFSYPLCSRQEAGNGYRICPVSQEMDVEMQLVSQGRERLERITQLLP